MNKLNLSIKKALTTSTLLIALGASTLALADNNARYNDNSTLKDAWIDGKVETALLVNRHLNNFTIDTDVSDNTVYLTGTVKSEVDKELAEEIARGIKGVDSVKNGLIVKNDIKMKDSKSTDEVGGERSFSDWYSDATTTAEIKSKYLLNSKVDGLDINVDTKYGIVTLNGEADSSATRNLAEQIAENTEGVRDVVNKLKI